MPGTVEADWQALGSSTQGLLCHAIHLLAARKFTGQMHLECNDGGIREITVSHKMEVSDLPKRPDA